MRTNALSGSESTQKRLDVKKRRGPAAFQQGSIDFSATPDYVRHRELDACVAPHVVFDVALALGSEAARPRHKKGIVVTPTSNLMSSHLRRAT